MQVVEYLTPDGAISGYLRERYYGMASQLRVCLVDMQGRVHHYDASEVSTAASRERGQVVHVP